MVSWRAKGYAVCGDFPPGKFIVYPSHAAADIFGRFRISSYSKASTSMIAALPGCLRLARRLSELAMSNMVDSRSTTAKGGLGVSGTAGGVLRMWLASTLHAHE
jgi:hypothetical protein